MDVSRRWFIGGLTSLGAFAGSRAFSAPVGMYADGRPLVRFGVISDVHVRLASDGKTIESRHDTETFEHALAWFRDREVDAVVIAGDIADRGFVEELQAVADAWYRVFPDDRAPDGRRVERIFTLGNHDWEGADYGRYGERLWPDKAERAKHLLCTDLKGSWERMFHEPFANVYRKDVKGYAFVGGHWTADRCRGEDEVGIAGVGEFFAAHGSKLDPAKPFFYVQHPHPRNTCYGEKAWGRDAGGATRALSAFPNAVAFSGHSHYSLTDERSIWQGAFTSLGTASLRYTSVYAVSDLGREGYENRAAPDRQLRPLVDPHKLMPSINTYDNRQGMLVSVYSDHLVFARREFMTDAFLGPDWVLPLPNAESRPFSIATRAATAAAPQFPAGAAVTVTRLQAKPRGGKGVPKKPVPALSVEFPAATAVGGVRPFEYEIVAETKEGAKFVKRILSPAYHFAPDHALAKGPARLVLAESALPKDVAFRFTVAPISCFAKKGAAIAGDWMKV